MLLMFEFFISQQMITAGQLICNWLVVMLWGGGTIVVMIALTVFTVCSVDRLILDDFVASCLVKAMLELSVAVDMLSFPIVMMPLVKRLMMSCDIGV